MSFMLLKVLSTVAVVTADNTIRMAVNLARLGKEVFLDM